MRTPSGVRGKVWKGGEGGTRGKPLRAGCHFHVEGLDVEGEGLERAIEGGGEFVGCGDKGDGHKRQLLCYTTTHNVCILFLCKRFKDLFPNIFSQSPCIIFCHI